MPDVDASLWAALHAGVAQVAAEVRRRIDHVVYRAQQTAIRVPLATTRAVASALVGGESPDPAAVMALRERYEALLARDLANVDEGLYPRSLLYQIPFARYKTLLETNRPNVRSKSFIAMLLSIVNNRGNFCSAIVSRLC